MSITPPEHEDITGHYVGVEIEGTDHRVYYEENGPEDGIPLLCQHTAGNHGHEWRHILADEDITEHFRVIAYDLPLSREIAAADESGVVEGRLHAY